MAQDLYQEVSARPIEFFKVDIITTPDGLPVRPYRKQVQAALAAHLDSVENDLLQMGSTIIYKSKNSPIISAEVKGHDLLNNIKYRIDFSSVIKHPTGQPTHFALQSTVDLNLSSAFYGDFFFGGGVKVGITGEDKGQHCTIANQYYYFNLHNKYPPRACSNDSDCLACDPDCSPADSCSSCNNGVCANFHGTAVAGMIGHVAGWLAFRGAPYVDLYFANESLIHQNQLDWLFSQGVYVENESWGGAPTNLYAQDYFSIQGMAVVESSGNSGVNAEAACHATNTFCIGAYTTLAQLWDSTSSRNPASCSRWQTGCDRELPHAVFHGGNAITTTHISSDPDHLRTLSGTSLAAPAAVSLIALLHDRWPAMFWGWPEPTRATLMASADRDVHTIPHTSTCPTMGKTYSDYHCPDERDGAGVPNASRIESMMLNNRIQKYTLLRDSSFDANGKLTLAQVSMQAGETLRAVISWDGCPNTSGYGAHADLDLHILTSGNYPLFIAGSYDETYEVAEIEAPATGVYTIKIQKHNWQDCPELGGSNALVYLGFAYDIR